jgi:peptidoglycan/LPS O-acetylase OafA/YrhL
MHILKRLYRRFIKHCRRTTTSGGYVPEIDGLRFIAITAVVACHVGGYWLQRAGRTYSSLSVLDVSLMNLISLGYYGVDLFFMISGFVLALPFCKQVFHGGKPVDLRQYLWRRVTRLEPPYVLSMLAFFAFLPFFGKESWAQLWPHLLASLGYFHNIVYGCGSLINNNAWSLEIEVQFYLLMPMMALLLWRPATERRLVFMAGAVFLSLHGLWLPQAFPKTFLQYGQYFLIGIVFGDLWVSAWWSYPRKYTADIPGVVAWPIFVWVNLVGRGLFANVASLWLIAMLFYSALRGKAHSRALSWGLVPIFGGMCYSIYLLHARVLAIAIHGLLSRLPSLGSFAADYIAVFCISSVAVLGVSIVYYLLVEKPCMDPAWPSKAIRWLRGYDPGTMAARKVGKTLL